MRLWGHERTGRGHERNDYWLGENGSDLYLVRTMHEKWWRGDGNGKGYQCPLRIRYLCQDVERPKKERAAYLLA